MNVFVENESVNRLLRQHRAVLEYELLIDSQQWSVIQTDYPDGPPECTCLVCRQLDALSDRLAILARNVQRYEKELHDASPDLDTTVIELLDIASTRRHLAAGGC
jgi:hypothetical protein